MSAGRRLAGTTPARWQRLIDATTNIVPPSGASGLTGFQTQIALNHRAKPGDGFFTREFWLHSFACYCWIEMGIADTLVPGSSGLFWSEEYMTQGRRSFGGSDHRICPLDQANN